MTEDKSLTFNRFPDLPPEIRNFVWNFSLPDLQPCLFLYQKGCWKTREAAPSDPEYNADRPDKNTIHEFRYDLLDVVQVKTPLLAVSIEARLVALHWARSKNMNVHIADDPIQLSPVLSHQYNYWRDILYIPMDEIDNLSREPLEYIFGDEHLNRPINVPCPQIRHIAFPIQLCQSDKSIQEVAEILGFLYLAIEEITLISDDDPIAIRTIEGFPLVRECWELGKNTLGTEQDGSDNVLLQQFETKLRKWWWEPEHYPQKLQVRSYPAVKR